MVDEQVALLGVLKKGQLFSNVVYSPLTLYPHAQDTTPWVGHLCAPLQQEFFYKQLAQSMT